ncbi:unnamed protein product [Fraxinus pennsylvanica]|uniref:Uncharacterized protein n=1 Tax=Fraxinus pennsylvanica TaxID=56036 RepID=A0AAD2DTP2_9LAMI|nr:unnamed protein product [Fraxinus pennsylvanica]
MGKFEGGKVVGSVNLDRSFTLWSALSGASFRQKIINSIRCGGGIPLKQTKTEKKQQSVSNKLSELLKQQEFRENEEKVRKKEKALEELKTVAKKLQQDSNSEILHNLPRSLQSSECFLLRLRSW